MHPDRDLDPTGRFSSRVDNYAKYRPGYPNAIIQFFRDALHPGKHVTIADIGSGTGLLTGPLLKEGYTVIGIEPNEDMLKAGAKRLSGFSNFKSLLQTAEETGLPGHSIDLITVAQAFHWMDTVATQKEFKRILKPGGQVGLLWNIRKKEGAFMQGLVRIKDQFRTDAKVPDNIDIKKISSFFGSNKFKKFNFPNPQLLDLDAFKGQVLSSSYIPLPGQSLYAKMIASVEQLFAEHNENGLVRMEFETVLYWGSL